MFFTWLLLTSSRPKNVHTHSSDPKSGVLFFHSVLATGGYYCTIGKKLVVVMYVLFGTLYFEGTRGVLATGDGGGSSWVGCPLYIRYVAFLRENNWTLYVEDGVFSH